MTNKQLQNLLKRYPEGLDVKLFKGYKRKKLASGGSVNDPIIHDFEDENANHVKLSDNEEYLLINPPIQ